ncbi:MAG TPA: hypothetical protein VN682_04565 [Terriglobales bacterium]|nr:hypothetical protein [Terriglobales bacterium]
MNPTLVRRLHKLEKTAGIQTRSVAVVEVYTGETLDEALARQAIDRSAHSFLFIVHGRDDCPR